MAAKKPFIELEPNLVIGIGQGSLTLITKSLDGPEKWECYHRQIADRLVATYYTIPGQLIRKILNAERLEKDFKAAYELGRRYKNTNAELENQLAEAERKRDVANRVNLESFNELHDLLAETKLSLSNKYTELRVKTNELSSCKKDFNQLDSLLQTNKTELAEITVRQAKLHYKNLIGWKTAIILFAIVIIEMFFIFNG